MWTGLAFFRTEKMSDTRNLTLRATAIVATVLVTSPPPFENPFALGTQLKGVQPAAASEPIALYITLCLWSGQRPATCRELPLTPGAAGPGFASMEACQDGQEEALGKWRAEAGPVFGFTGMVGDGYRIEGQRCGVVVGRSQDE
jgi:hypothetical protein